MLRLTRFTAVTSGSAPPGWVVRAAATAFALVLAVPIVLLLLLALAVASIVFGVLWLGASVRGMLPARDGRENVRVIRPGNVIRPDE